MKLSLILLCSGLLLAQTIPTPRASAVQTPVPKSSAPAFEVASIKPAGPARYPLSLLRGGPGTNDPGQFRYSNVTLRELLRRAFALRDEQVVGPPWLDQDRFDIAAKVAAGATKEQVNPMLQNLLMERFSLTFHRETRDLPVYELVVVKGGLKMKEAAKPPGATPAALPLGPSQIVRGKDGSDELGSGSRGWVLITGKEPGTKRISARSQTVAEVIPLFQTLLGRSVVDKTGLTGTYDFNVDFVLYEPGLAGIGSPSAPEPPSEQATPADGVSIPSMGLIGALESRLGLKMVAGKGPVEVLVVDRVNRQPTEN